jgi:branched-chain amino acid transport system ATP-binding protein
MTPDVILETSALCKGFKGFRAVQDVSLKVRRGHIHALIGPNGAGKTTVFNLLTKFLKPCEGTIRYEGRDITPLAPAEVARHGLIRSFQISAVFGHMSALENVRVALQKRHGMHFAFWLSKSRLDRFNDEAMLLLDHVGLAEFAHTLAAELAYGRKRALEIATTLAMEPRLMLLDEPTQGMGHEDVDRIMRLIKKVSSNRTVLMVEHNMKVVAGICDRITVLQRGSVLAEGSYHEVSKDPRVVEAYIGSDEEEAAA